jgi:hypothetical protein
MTVNKTQVLSTVKDYFGDGFVPGSAPFNYHVHFCHLRQRETKDKSFTSYGVEIDEHAMPLFSVLGDTSQPPCSCHEIQAVVRHIDDWCKAAPDFHPDDYKITTGKDDNDAQQVCLYAVRDALSWWVHWAGEFRHHDYWKVLYVAFSTVTDDLQLPPTDFLDGSFRLLGHTWIECRDGLMSEGVPAETVKFAEMSIWRQVLIQYMEKVDPGLRPLLVSKTTLMTQFRNITANTFGCAALFLSSQGSPHGGVEDDALEMATICDCLSMDMAKEALGVLEGEKTETVAGDRALRKKELRWVYSRCLEHLGEQRNGHLLRRFATSGLHFVPMMDRYLERTRGKRFPISEDAARILSPFMNRP